MDNQNPNQILPQPDPENMWFELAKSFVFQTTQSVFLTGKAGTGKTTFLKYVKENCFKQLAVLAPTGVAAIHAGGVTIHSFLQLPFGTYVPEPLPPHSQHDAVYDAPMLRARVRFNRDKRQLLQSLELLIIDEISMVRADVMDAMDNLLQYVRQNSAPFGGLQVLMIGDMHQLPPVVKDLDWQWMQPYYNSPFFFSSQAMQGLKPVYVELQTIYRQNEASFIELLNQVRTNTLNEEGLQLLNSRYLPGFKPPPNEHYITLSTHNATADAINQRALKALPGKEYHFEATIEGDFPERNYPAEQKLILKTGAQVMFIKNDTQSPRRYFNGKIGVITNIDPDEGIIQVKCKDEALPIAAIPVVWENTQYRLNTETQQVEEKCLGAFIQYPLRLAWAVTIHKSQGLTFEKAIVDAGQSFSAGQVYVALSRCTTLDGMVLYSKITPAAVFTDSRVVQFGSQKMEPNQLQQYLHQARHQFELQLLTDLFGSHTLQPHINRLVNLIQQHAGSFKPNPQHWCALVEEAWQPLLLTCPKFIQQLYQLSTPNTLPSNNPSVQQRVQQAVPWYLPRVKGLIQACTQQLPTTDNEELAPAYEGLLGQLLTTLGIWEKSLQQVQQGLNTEALLRMQAKARIEAITGRGLAKVAVQQQSEARVAHPELLRKLKQYRQQKALEEDVPAFKIAPTVALEEMCNYLPQNRQQLLQLKGFGQARARTYGPGLLQVVAEYCLANGLHTLMDSVRNKEQTKPKPNPQGRVNRAEAAKPAKQPKPDTRLETLNLYQQGHTVEEIAAIRGLQATTIETHLIRAIMSGDVPQDAFLSHELFEEISAMFQQMNTIELNPVREALGNRHSYGKLRLVRDVLLKEGILKGNVTAGNPGAQ